MGGALNPSGIYAPGRSREKSSPSSNGVPGISNPGNLFPGEPSKQKPDMGRRGLDCLSAQMRSSNCPRATHGRIQSCPAKTNLKSPPLKACFQGIAGVTRSYITKALLECSLAAGKATLPILTSLRKIGHRPQTRRQQASRLQRPTIPPHKPPSLPIRRKAAKVALGSQTISCRVGLHPPSSPSPIAGKESGSATKPARAAKTTAAMPRTPLHRTRITMPRPSESALEAGASAREAPPWLRVQVLSPCLPAPHRFRPG